LEDADSERKAFQETFGRATDKNGDMVSDEDREAVEISRDFRRQSLETSWRTQTWKGKPFMKLSGGRLMKVEIWCLTRIARQ